MTSPKNVCVGGLAPPPAPLIIEGIGGAILRGAIVDQFSVKLKQSLDKVCLN